MPGVFQKLKVQSEGKNGPEPKRGERKVKTRPPEAGANGAHPENREDAAPKTANPIIVSAACLRSSEV